MKEETHQKVKATHLQRNAYLYIRQSTPRQVIENTESTKRQYALRQRALALGWSEDRIIVIDSDLGLSGASAADREGFQRLVTEVSLGRAGIVLGLEVSRLARNSTDWHRLLEICAFSDALILDEDGIYDPAHFNDRLLLGLKGTMSEAELHVLGARCGVESSTRLGVVNYRSDRPSDWRTTPKACWHWTRTSRFNIHCVCCLRHSGGPGPLRRRSRLFTIRRCCSPDAFLVDRRKEMWFGVRSAIAKCCGSSTTRGMRGPLCSEDITFARGLTVLPRSSGWPRPTGTR